MSELNDTDRQRQLETEDRAEVETWHDKDGKLLSKEDVELAIKSLQRRREEFLKDLQGEEDD